MNINQKRLPPSNAAAFPSSEELAKREPPKEDSIDITKSRFKHAPSNLSNKVVYQYEDQPVLKQYPTNTADYPKVDLVEFETGDMTVFFTPRYSFSRLATYEIKHTKYVDLCKLLLSEKISNTTIKSLDLGGVRVRYKNAKEAIRIANTLVQIPRSWFVKSTSQFNADYDVERLYNEVSQIPIPYTGEIDLSPLPEYKTDLGEKTNKLLQRLDQAVRSKKTLVFLAGMAVGQLLTLLLYVFLLFLLPLLG